MDDGSQADVIVFNISLQEGIIPVEANIIALFKKKVQETNLYIIGQ